MSNYLDILAELILISSFFLISGKRVSTYIKAFRIQSLLIAIGAAILGVNSLMNEGRFDILIVCAIMVLLKVIFIPNYLTKVSKQVDPVVEKGFFLNIPILVSICFAIVIFVYFSVHNISGINEGSSNIRLVYLISVVLIGILFMITRKKAFGQIIGFLVIENGLFVTAMFATHGMPFIIDIGVFIDLLTGVLIMGLMVFKIDQQFDSININNLKNLKG